MTRFGSALVTGATGFIGYALTRRLSNEGIRTFCLVREGRYNPAAFDTLPGISVIEIPSSAGDSLPRALSGMSAETVFNLASYGVNPDEQDPEIMLDANVNFLSRLMLATSAWTLKRFIHIGSCFEYGEPTEQTPMPEEHPLRPLSLYGAAKAASVLFGTALAARLKMPVVTLRLFGVYGPGERSHRLIPYIMSRLSSNSAVDLTPGGQVRDLLYIDDVVDALVAAASLDSVKPSSVYNVCSGVPVTVREVGESVAKVMDRPSSLLHWGERAYRASEAMWLVGENRRFQEATGWRQKTSLMEGITRMAIHLQASQYAKGRA
jgi:UDP-glucose 4-epimerase